MARSKSGGHPGKRPQHKLRVIDKPEEGTRSVLQQAAGAEGPFMIGSKGRGSMDYVCGSCGYVLLEEMGYRQSVVNVVLVCPSCGAYNDTGGAPQPN